MRNILYVLLLGMTVCVLAASCGGGQARREALLDILSSTSTDGQTDFARLDSLEKVAPDADEHERVVRRLVRAWLTTFETQQAAPDSVTAPIVDYLEKHGTPRERVRALLLHGIGLERRGNAADAQLMYQKALRLARQGGDSTQVLLCWMRLGELYTLRTELRHEMTEAYRNAMRLAEQLGDTSRLSSCHANLGRLYIAALPGDSLYDHWQEGVAHYRKAIELAHEADNEFDEMNTKYELAALYSTRQHPYEALPLLQETKDFKFRTFPDQKGAVLFSLITVFLQLDRPDSAQVYIDQALALPANQNNIRYHVYEMLFQYYQAKKQSDLVAWAADSLFHYQPAAARQQVSTQVAEVKEKYANEQLSESHARVSREHNNSILIGISVAVVLLVIIVWGRKAYRDRLHRREYLLHEKDEVINTLQTHLEEEKAHVEEVTGRLLDIEGREYELRHALTNDTELMQRLRKEPKFLDDSEWEKLKAVVDDVYKDFTVRLHERFPQLSEVYIRYCILIKLRFTVSQIAILMAVAPSSVSQQKSRIKKRLLQTEGFVFGEGETLDEWIGRF
ncbi:hypothetical protein [Phocaeicola salanitronis]|uniref:hypothetical protein n=1 Tax=Phocaeicola salanitronis TaxID=376805 RepID=UPI0025A4BEEC|nr:hypothetical protein [Phocaeicola salanitronis]MDM8305184.1 hypothetical protein [Phocaeicola salanitronis]